MASRHVLGGAALAATLALAVPFEGLATKPYHDKLAHGLVTWCYGETVGFVKMSDTFTPKECKDKLAARLPQYWGGIDKCIHVSLSDNKKAAATDLAYNIGVKAVCHSTFVRRLNAGDPNACDSILLYNRASGKVVAGLTRRREAERALCMRDGK